MKQETFKEIFKRKGVVPISAIPLKHKIPDDPQKWVGVWMPLKNFKPLTLTRINEA